MDYEFLTRVSLDVRDALIQSLCFMVTLLQSLRLCLLRALSLLIFSATCNDQINPFLSTTGSISMEEERLSDKVLQNSSKKLLGIGEPLHLKGALGTPCKEAVRHYWGLLCASEEYP